MFLEWSREKTTFFRFLYDAGLHVNIKIFSARNRDAPTYEKVILVFFEFSLNKEMLLNAGQSVTFFGPLSVSTSWMVRPVFPIWSLPIFFFQISWKQSGQRLCAILVECNLSGTFFEIIHWNRSFFFVSDWVEVMTGAPSVPYSSVLNIFLS